jgi:hypothetical protein
MKGLELLTLEISFLKSSIERLNLESRTYFQKFDVFQLTKFEHFLYMYEKDIKKKFVYRHARLVNKLIKINKSLEKNKIKLLQLEEDIKNLEILIDDHTLRGM